MTVRELINRLNKLDKKSEVILSVDSEGNGYSVLNDLSIGYYDNESYGSVDYHDEDVIDESNVRECNKCICLWPTT